MAIQTVETSAVEKDLRLGTSTRHRSRSCVGISRAGVHEVGPIPSVPRQVRVFRHHGPFGQRGARRHVLFLDDHRAIGHLALAVFDGDPVEQRRRVPDSDVRMDAVARSNLRIVLPVLFLVAEVVHEGSEMNEESGSAAGGSVAHGSFCAELTPLPELPPLPHAQRSIARPTKLSDIRLEKLRRIIRRMHADASQDPW